MKKIYFFIVLSCFIMPIPGIGQTTYLPLHSEEYHILNKLETFSGTLAPFSTALRPISRKDAVNYLVDREQKLKTNNISLGSYVSIYDIQRAISISGEWAKTAEGMDRSLPSKKPILKYFYQKQADMINIHTDDFFLVVNPVLYIEAVKEKNNGDIGYFNTRGLELRGRIKNRIGFYTMLADNQVKPVSYIQGWEMRHDAFPGMDYYRKTGSGNYDLFMARGYVDANFIKDHLNVTFGYDKNFIGDGIRSLVLSDFSAPSTFLRLRSHYGLFSYENLFMELAADYKRGGDNLIPHKYATINQLNFRATKWLRIGIFESTVFSGTNNLKVGNLIPIIFYQTVAQALDNPQKTSLGFNFKAIALHHLQFYGQAFFDQFKLNELGNGWWGNQFGIQLGGKYFDAFTLKNLDLQGEVNMVRPFTYASNEYNTDYTHYNQPLAHPYGAGFAEVIGVAHYQPLPKLYLTAKGIYSLRSTDSSSALNFGNDIFKSYDSRTRDYNYNLIPGKKITGIYLNFNAAYEVRPRLFIEAGATYLRRTYKDGVQLPSSTSFYGGIRWNISRTEYDFY